ncbi:PREDICTED: pentatricopeptide repeat-containing protein At1g61870, mitochondrial [Nelumbo nucifera]|uniref:Pentatricopeptide repeat-containing protein At1g61870, mitochondrial n=1 Tax=Nelumbo nucifera TaxID=4432 RepID=A0A1U8AK64_NELNU|nr:PREDICTED: pentatricopeptide repeat-containing protein At1g61870, mitochondrial [Nelumbo nucifera]XP_010267685.1 PREDICTED: pentatricopeptide repeat-containing protein At1g61870, mitochondrial [Nelumbo nucifera]XP_010267686.1 PREDICTED: pentatricopeptide repeat-containing protein At1g61870, mitochondrial [Nelumbo nucifera]XP_010267687.1 PREDICTED: pentatricopeptide repeat-containing protein At1g61870, mitochondrial [Nelumbo nucifera]
MASFSRLRINSLLHRRHFSSILSPDSTTPLTSKQKSRAAIALLKSEKNPERIIDICRAASLTPELHLDRIAFSIAISKLTESNSFEGIRSFLEELKTRSDLKNERFLSHAIVLYGQAGMLDHAIRTFKQMDEMGIPRSTKSLNALLFACIVAKKHDEVSRIFLEFPRAYGITPDIDTYNTVIKSFCESGSSSSVYSILAEMSRKGCKPNATSFGTLLAGFYKEEKYEDVAEVLELMKKHDVHQGVSTYNIRIQSLCKMKKSPEAKALFDGMLARGMKPNTNTYFHLIYGFCNEGDLEEAKRLFKDMSRKGCVPQSDCYFTLIYYLCQGGDFDTALQLCKDSLAKNWVPNFTTMKTLVNGLASSSKVEEARELVGQMKERFGKNANMWEEIEEGLPQ